jgi:hypothetical protein
MDHAYKSHTIVITTWASLDRNGYTPEVRISKETPIIFQNLKVNKAFPTKEEAENLPWKSPKSGLTPKSQNTHKRLTKAP